MSLVGVHAIQLRIPDHEALPEPAEPEPQTRTAPLSRKAPLHCLATARCRQGISRRLVARHMGMTIAEVRAQEEGDVDISLDTLRRWSEILQVPLVELLVEPDESLSPPIQQRARLVRVMKTVKAILEQSREESILRLATTMGEQLTEIMPELKDVGPWNAVGSRRPTDDVGQAASRCVDFRIIPELFD